MISNRQLRGDSLAVTLGQAGRCFQTISSIRAVSITPGLGRQLEEGIERCI